VFVEKISTHQFGRRLGMMESRPISTNIGIEHFDQATLWVYGKVETQTN